MSAVTIDATTAQWLVAGTLNSHMLDDDPDDLGCCPVCCGPCAALKQLLDAGQLDDIARGYAVGGWDWWDEANDRVDRERLARVWRLTGCHDDPYAAQVAKILAGADARRNPYPRDDTPDRLRALVDKQHAAATRQS